MAVPHLLFSHILPYRLLEPGFFCVAELCEHRPYIVGGTTLLRIILLLPSLKLGPLTYVPLCAVNYSEKPCYPYGNQPLCA